MGEAPWGDGGCKVHGNLDGEEEEEVEVEGGKQGVACRSLRRGGRARARLRRRLPYILRNK